MAEKVGEIYYDVTLETQDLINKNRDVNRELDKTKGNLNGLDAQLKQTAAAAKALFAGLGVLAIIDKADEWGQYASRIRMATKSTEEYNQVQERMLESANGTFRSINETRESFIQLSPVMREMGLSLGQSLDAIDAFSGLLVTNAASSDRAAAAQVALSKSLQKGKIDADAWMSIYSTMDSIVDVIAASSGKTGEEIRKLGAEGKLSVETLVQALVSGSPTIKRQVGEMPTTFRDALQNLSNGFTEYIGKNNEAYGVTAILVKGVALLGENFDLLANAGPVAVAAGLARYTLGATASAAATAYKALTAVSATAAEVRLAEAEVATTAAALAQANALRRVGVATAETTALTAAHQAALVNLTKTQTAHAAAQAVSSAAIRAGLALLGGPAGIAIAAGLAAAAWFSYSNASDAAKKGMEDMQRPLEQIAAKFKEMTRDQQKAALVSATEAAKTAAEDADAAYEKLRTSVANALGRNSSDGMGAKRIMAFKQALDEARASGEPLTDVIERFVKQVPIDSGRIATWTKLSGEVVTADSAVRHAQQGVSLMNDALNNTGQAAAVAAAGLARIGPEAQTQIDNLKRRIALFNQSGTAAGIYYDLEHGALKDLNKAEKESIRLQADKLAVLEKNGKPKGNAVARANGAQEYYEGLVAANALALDRINAEERKALAENSKRLADDKANAEVYAKARVEIVKKYARERASDEEQTTQEVADLNIGLITNAEAKIAAIRDEAIRRANAGVQLGAHTVEQAERAKTAAIAQAERERAALQERLSQTQADNNIAAAVSEVARIDLIRQEAFRSADAAAKSGAITYAQAEAEKARATIDAQNSIRQQMLSINPIAALESEYQEKLAIVRLYEQRMAQAGVDASAFTEQQKTALANQYQQQRMALAEVEFAAQSNSNALLMDSLNGLASTGASAISGLLTGTQSATESMQALAGVVLNEAVAALIQIGLQQIKNALIGDTLAAAEKARAVANGTLYAASVTAQVAGMSALAAQNAFAATAAIPIVGPILAPAAAATAGAAAAAIGSPAIATAPVAGARQYGGPTEAGKFYRVNETGQPEMYTASNGSQYMLGTKSGNVTPANEVGGGQRSMVVNIHNAPPGTWSTTSPDGHQIDVFIEKTKRSIAADINNNEGSIWTAFKSSTNLAGRF
ncbi:tape measure protein [Comamonadaceae bacterium PP-2]